MAQSDRVIHGDCLEVLDRIEPQSIDLVFADPPFNIGIRYHGYKDNQPFEEYRAWTQQWLDKIVPLLKKNGSVYIAIGDEFAGDMRVLLRNTPLIFRNWIIWHYTFGQQTTKKFSRAHTHIFYFVMDEKNFTFNDDDIRVPSDRQLKYSDKRANPKGKVPDDVWLFSRICGTFKERVGKHPCQMPENLLERIILASSNRGELVLDPFAGTGTTLAVAKKLGRHYIGIEQSDIYYDIIQKRLDSTGNQLSLFD